VLHTWALVWYLYPMLRTWAAAPETSVSGWPSRRWKPSQPSSRTTHDRVGFLSHISHSSWHRCSTSQNHQRHLGACQKCALRPCPNYGVRICILTPQVMHIHDTRSTAMDYFVLKTMKWHWMFLQLQYFFFFCNCLLCTEHPSWKFGNYFVLPIQRGLRDTALKGISDCTARNG